MIQCLLSACHFSYSNRFANGLESIINIDGDHTSAVTQTENNIAKLFVNLYAHLLVSKTVEVYFWIRGLK